MTAAQTPEDYRRRAVELLDKAAQARPGEIGQEVDETERLVVRLRDALIEQSRQATEPGEGARVRAALKKVNAALSLIVGVEYPVKGFHKELLKEARGLLQDLGADSLHAS